MDTDPTAWKRHRSRGVSKALNTVLIENSVERLLFLHKPVDIRSKIRSKNPTPDRRQDKTSKKR